MSKSETVLSHFLSHREVTKELVHKIEENQYDFKPTETSMRTQTLVKHMIHAFYAFATIAQTGDPSFLSKKPVDQETNLIDLVEKYTTLTIETIRSINDDDLLREIDLTKQFGRKLTSKQLLQMAIDHEINHKGNLFVYLRLMGNTELPLFVKR
ncbi:DinB family protein [Robertmurraya kyonggiensis]|uniref:DUF664 domain-containing protein n=1 Tax=Robertmurraya kyonggiensis TaxID=1037680 RepID=A0A4U1DD19_9BACI|nr:DinB family protein [Robertmurraya kyonggiensis]TKC19497.1 DUF664 domain-containing protein [Robertmurraya kyonggiensis]